MTVIKRIKIQLNKRIFLLSLFILSILNILLFSLLCYQGKIGLPLMPHYQYRAFPIKISEKVMFDNYKTGTILVMAKSKEAFLNRTRPDIAITYLSSPGDYILEIPNGADNVYLEAVNVQDILQGPEFSFNAPYGVYADNPLHISSSNIKDVDIVLNEKRLGSMDILMSTYKGPTVTVSGKVDFEFWFENPKGTIWIVVRSEKAYKENTYPDIAIEVISKPGKYTLKLPNNIGNVYIEAIAMKKGEMFLKPIIDSPVGTYIKNPVNIGSKDIKDVNISLLKSKSSLMATYEGPTVTVSGKIIFPNYKRDVIWIIARSEVGYRRDFYPDMVATVIPRPGKYTLELPKGIGKVYIEAANVPEAQTHGDHPPSGDAPFGDYNKNPLIVEDSPMDNIDIKLDTVFSKRAKPFDDVFSSK